MIKKISVVATPIYFNDLFSPCRSKRKAREEFTNYLKDYLSSEHIFLLNSATSSIFTILNALRIKSAQKNEVILPAYTTSSLVMAIKRSGLKPVICDISLDDFNLDFNKLSTCVSERTLAILGVHMFGIVSRGLKDLKNKYPGCFIIEDCAQALGSKIDGKPVGHLGDISFFSFNRGKNLPTYGGGAISVNHPDLILDIKKALENIKDAGTAFRLSVFFKIFALSLAVRPFFYGLLYPFIAPFKGQKDSLDFEVKKYTDFQAALALSLSKRIDKFNDLRYNNGIKLISALQGLGLFIVPRIYEDTRPAFNRLPVICKDLKIREKIERRLWKAGVETSRMYLKPLHHMLDLGYKKEDFPNANYLAEHLLTLPIHPSVKEKDLLKMINIIKEAV